MLISIFFIAYLCMEVPSNLVLTRTRPSWYVPAIMVVWGTITAAMSQCRGYTDILVARFFLGAVEAGFFPGVMFIMSSWYLKAEIGKFFFFFDLGSLEMAFVMGTFADMKLIGKRFAIFFTALCFAGAVSGLVSGAVISGLEGARGMEGWRWLFLIEGVGTVFFGFVARFVLLDYPENTARLTPAERQLAIVRMMHDRQATSALQTAKLPLLKAVRAAVTDFRTYVFVVLYMLDNGSTTISYFIPTVLKSMGYQGVDVQWMTIPVWGVATVFLLVVPQIADRLGDNRWAITAGLTMSFVSAIILFQVEHNITRYVFLCFYISGLYYTLPLIMTWCSTLMPLPAEKRAVVIAMTNSIGNLSAVYGSQIWPATDAPTYSTGFTAVACFTGAGAVIAAVAPYLFKILPTFPTKEEKEAMEAQRRAQEEME